LSVSPSPVLLVVTMTHTSRVGDPGLPRNFPGGQAVHADCSAAAMNLPAGQSLQQLVRFSSWNLPEKQLVQNVEVISFWNFPLGQSLQLVWPTSAP
jgi:hypothetical protein